VSRLVLQTTALRRGRLGNPTGPAEELSWARAQALFGAGKVLASIRPGMLVGVRLSEGVRVPFVVQGRTAAQTFQQLCRKDPTYEASVEVLYRVLQWDFDNAAPGGA